MQIRELSIQENRKYLKNLRDELTQRIVVIENDVRHKELPVEKDFTEQVTQRENDDVLNTFDDKANSHTDKRGIKTHR